MVRLGAMDSDSLASATREILENFCTIGKHPPRSATRLFKMGRFDECLFNGIRSKVQILVTDAAAAEILASNILRGRRLGSERQPLLGSVLLIGRDAAHAATRLLKRPWAVIDRVRDVVVKTITSSESIAQKIFHSNVYSDMLQKEIAVDANLPQVASLSAAKHRFASFSKPLGRIVLHIQAVFRVLHSIMFLRNTPVWCKDWLNSMNGESLLLLGLAADAADSLLEFVRALDMECFDPAGLNGQVQDFLSNVDVLFGSPAQAFEVSGYARHCWTSLRENPVFVLHGGRQKQIVVDDACREAAMQVMRPWVRHVFAACQAEFPDYHIFASMEVLNVAVRDEEPRHGRDSQEQSKCIARLSKILDVCPHKAAAELQTLFPVARGLQRRNNCGNRAAWALALQRTQKTAASRARYPILALSKLLVAHACWTTSTSGVEQNFSKSERCSGNKRFGPKASNAEARSLIVLGFKEDGSATAKHVAQLARRIYSVSKKLGKYSRSRLKDCRLDKGLRRPGARNGNTEQAFIRKRRAEVREVARPFRRAFSEQMAESEAVPVSEKGQKELQMQANAASQKQLEAYRDGYLDDDGQGLEDLARKSARNEATLDRQRSCKRALIQSNLSSVRCKVEWKWQQLRHGEIWFGPGVTLPENAPQLRQTEDIRRASIFFVDDSGNVPAKVYFAAAACGGDICSATILHGQGGLCTRYSAEFFQALAAQHKGVYVTSAFKRDHASLTALLRWGVQQNWFAAVSQDAVKKQSWCLVAEQDAETAFLKRKSQHCLTKKMFIDLLLGRCVRRIERVQGLR